MNKIAQILVEENIQKNMSLLDLQELQLKGTLMQIWKTANIFVFRWRQYVEYFILKYLLLFEICAREIYEKFVYKHSETIEYVKTLPDLLRNLQTLQANNSRILRIKNVKFLGYCFYMNTKIKEDFQICISVTLKTWLTFALQFLISFPDDNL